MNHGVSFQLNNPDKVRDLIGYPDDLATALVNIVGNSIHWLSDARTNGPEIRIGVRALPGQAEIMIDDNGPGVRDEFANSIFDVGFTLKRDGTGLGLNIAREALARSDGTLAFHPDFPDGTRFEIRFPRVEDPL